MEAKNLLDNAIKVISDKFDKLNKYEDELSAMWLNNEDNSIKEDRLRKKVDSLDRELDAQISLVRKMFGFTEDDVYDLINR